MKTVPDESAASDELMRQSTLSREMHSIRTRFSLATGLLLLLALAAFYVGGRVVLVHLVRDAEQRVKEIGSDLSSIAYRNAERARTEMLATYASIPPQMKEGRVDERGLLGTASEPLYSVSVRLTQDGRLQAGAYAPSPGKCVPISAVDLVPYISTLSAWCTRLKSGVTGKAVPVGVMHVRGTHHYVTVIGRTGGFRLIGIPFSAAQFTSSMDDRISGARVHVTTRTAAVRANVAKASRSDRRNQFGFAPFFSEAANFYTGGFWSLDVSPLEAVFAVRDISGNAVSMISVSLPKTLSSIAVVAVSRLTFFIGIVGMLLVLPIFWVQGRILLNPLSKMTKAVRELSEHHEDTDCPRLEWSGKDEFAMLAASVNRMLETVSARTVAVAQLETRHQALINGVPDALAVFDRNGRLVTITKQPEGVDPLSGFVEGEIPVEAVFGREGLADFCRALDGTFATGRVGTVRLSVVPPIGMAPTDTTRHFELRLTKLDGHFALAIVRDTTAEAVEHRLRLLAESRINDSRKRESLTLLAAGIAHDMNNVLSVVLNAAEAVDADPSGDSAQTLATIRDAVRRGASMMHELRTYAGENRMTLMRVNPRLILDDIRVLTENVVGKNVVLSFVTAPDVPDVDADPNQFWKVIFNIVKNAGEALGNHPGHIVLSAVPFEMNEYEAMDFVSEHPLPVGRGVLFKISDDGPGIALELLPKLFDPYVSSKSVGRGLGLATVRTIVEGHGGGICVRSRVDDGTSFFVYLPESRLPAAAAAAAPVAPATVQTEKTTGAVLVVDNDDAILKTASILLKTMKLEAFVARDRHEAMAVVRRHARELALIVLDANLGNVDTVRLLRAFRIGAPNVRIVVSSGSPEEEIRELFRPHPFDAFLAKPYTVTEFKKAIG